jgi:hypothetical protein
MPVDFVFVRATLWVETCFTGNMIYDYPRLGAQNLGVLIADDRPELVFGFFGPIVRVSSDFQDIQALMALCFVLPNVPNDLFDLGQRSGSLPGCPATYMLPELNCFGVTCGSYLLGFPQLCFSPSTCP